MLPKSLSTSRSFATKLLVSSLLALMPFHLSAAAPLNGQEAPFMRPTAPARSLNLEQKIAFKEKMAALEEAEEQENEGEEIQSKGTNHIPMPHEGQYHFIRSLSYHGDNIELEDGTNWKISWFDRKKAAQWFANDTIIIKAANWYNLYDYQLENETTGNSVSANLTTTPILFGPYSLWVTELEDNHAPHKVLLRDGSLWLIHPSDSSTAQDWQLNDHVIIGLNKSWFSSSSYPHILINSATDTYIRAACLN